MSGDRTRPDGWRLFSYPEYGDVRHAPISSNRSSPKTGTNAGLEEGGRMRRDRRRLVSSNYFAALGATLAAGRSFTAAEERPNGATAVAIVSYPFWRRHGFDPALVGGSLNINGGCSPSSAWRPRGSRAWCR
jgi:hypothetical protein